MVTSLERVVGVLAIVAALTFATCSDNAGPATLVSPQPPSAQSTGTGTGPSPPTPDPTQGRAFSISGSILTATGPWGEGFGIWGAVIQAENRDTGEIEGWDFSDNDGDYWISGLRGEGYVLGVLPPAGYGKPRPQHVDRPRGSSVRGVDFDLDYEFPDPDERFDRVFWNQMLFNTYDCPTSDDCPDFYVNGDPIEELPERRLFIQSNPAPNFYIVTDGFSSREVREIEDVIPGVVLTLSGAPAWYGTIETGRDRDDIEGWITVRAGAPDRDEEWCGWAFVGRSSGSVTIDPDRPRDCPLLPVLRHEIAHAMGLFHTEDGLLATHGGGEEFFSVLEVYHSQFAYQHWRGMQYQEGPQLPEPPLTSGLRSGYVIDRSRHPIR